MPPATTRAPLVVAVDGSPESRSAVLWTARWARLADAPLELWSVKSVWHRSSVLRKQFTTALLQELDRYADEVGDVLGFDVDAERVVVSPGRSIDMLLRRTRDARAVVVGMEGIGGWSSAHRGRMTAELRAAAQCPVVLVPRAPQSESPAAPPPEPDGPVVVAVNGSSGDEPTERFASRYAREHGSGLVILWDDGLDPAPLSTALSVPPDVTVTEQATGDLVGDLARCSEQASVIVLGVGGEGVLPVLPARAVGELLQMTRCPVALVPST